MKLINLEDIFTRDLFKETNKETQEISAGNLSVVDLGATSQGSQQIIHGNQSFKIGAKDNSRKATNPTKPKGKPQDPKAHKKISRARLSNLFQTQSN